MDVRYAFFALVAFVAMLLVGWFWLKPQSPPKPQRAASTLPEPCRDMTFEGVAYIVCQIDPRAYAISLTRVDGQGRPYGSLAAFDRAMAEEGTPALLAMNAGMYHEGLGPVGLFVENGREETPLNTENGQGNFFLKPNGVFFVRADGSAAVLETSAYASAAPEVAYATQSGPMLVIEGKIHPRFEPDGTSRYIRNGVGVRKDGLVMLAISRTPVSLGRFARLFRNALECPNALFLDGGISSLSDGRNMLVGGKDPVGPILAVRKR